MNAVRFLHCSDNLENYNLCLIEDVAGFTVPEPQTGDLIYLIVRRETKTVCGARGVLGEKTEKNPFRNPNRFVVLYTIDWEETQEFSLTPMFDIEPSLKQLFLGRPHDIRSTSKAQDVINWLSDTFESRRKTLNDLEKQFRFKLKKLILKNFRGFIDQQIPLNPQFNAIIGDNGKGKSSILDALAISLSTYFSGFDVYYAKGIQNSDMRVNPYSANLEKQPPTEISAKGIIDGKELNWTRSMLKEGGTTAYLADSRRLGLIATKYQNQVRANSIVNLPLLAYYGTDRLWKNNKREVETSPKGSRLNGYESAFHAGTDSKAFLAWMKTQELAGLQKTSDPDLLMLVKAVISVFLEKETVELVFFDVQEDTLMLQYLNRETNLTGHLPWYTLSDGYRNIIAMAADLAIRCVTLNPHLRSHAAEQTEGVVLIDEIDLHLHPNWQRRVVDCFRKAFPKVQFIVTTHSPQIISSVRSENVLSADKNFQINKVHLKTEGEDSNSLLKYVLNSTERPEKYENLINKFNVLLEQNAPYAEAQAIIRQIEVLESDDDATIISNIVGDLTLQLAAYKFEQEHEKNN